MSSGPPEGRPPQTRWSRLSASLAAGLFALACNSDYAVGTWACAEAPLSPETGADGGAAGVRTAISLPWSTSFEDGFCGYKAVDGFCYSDPDASYGLATSPVLSGRRAAAFTVDTASPDAQQARCVREGVLPTEAYYGAWYFIPSAPTNTGNWNLFHFQGAALDEPGLHGLWDVSLVSGPDGELSLGGFDFLAGSPLAASAAPPIPIGSWFHLQVHLRRAADATGAVTVYQDGVVAHQLDNVITDDSEWGQWYVGNLANALSPSESTVYVDDVEISETR